MILTLVSPATLQHAGGIARLVPGDVVIYLGHLPYGNILVRFGDIEGIMNPLATRELR